MQHFHVEASWRELESSSFRPVYGLAAGLLCKQEDCQHVSLNKTARRRYLPVFHQQSFIEGWCACSRPHHSLTDFFCLETCTTLLAQTLSFINLRTGKHYSMVFPFSYTYLTMYLFLLSKGVYSIKKEYLDLEVTCTI